MIYQFSTYFFKLLYFFFLIVLSTLLTSKAFSQNSPYKLFTTNEGLIHNRCGNIAQDSMGYIWITTDNGICNYDGRKFNFFKGPRSEYYFAHNNTINMYNGACIMGTSGQGIARLIGNEVNFIYPKNETPSFCMSAIQLNDSTYVTLVLRDRKMQIVTNNTVKYISFPPQLQSTDIQSFLILQDVEKNIWIGTNKGFVIYEKGDFKKPFILPQFFKKYISVLKEDAKHNLFISCDSAMYCIKAEGLKNIKTIVPLKFSTQPNEITAVGTFANGDIAFGKYFNQLVIYNKDLKIIQEGDKTITPDKLMWDIFIDKEQNMWLATENGVYRYGSLSIKNYVYNNSAGAPQVKVGTSVGDVFLFSNRISIKSLTNGKVAEVTVKDKSIFSMDIITLKNKVWVNDYDPFDENRGKFIRQFSLDKNTLSLDKIISSPQVNEEMFNLNSVITLPNGNICLLTKRGKLKIYKNGKNKPVIIPSSINDISFASMCKGNLPFGAILVSNKNGLFHINFVEDEDKAVVQLLQHVSLNSFGIVNAVDVVLDNYASIWVATNNKGLLYFTQKNQQYQFAKHFIEPEISSTLLTSIFKDSKGNIWIGSNKGLDKIVINVGLNVSINKAMYKNYTLGNYIYLLKEHKGILHIGSSGGLTTVPIDATLQSIAPNVYINKITNNGKEFIANAVNNIAFEYNQNNFGFEFTSPTFINENQTEYQYKLDGIDAIWSEPSNNYNVNYNLLPSGNYTFRVRSKNANAVWSVKDATFVFTIKKPFYKHWLFILLCFAIMASILYWLYIQKMNKVKAVEKTRLSISKDLHDDIGTTLSSITLMNVVLKSKIETQPEEAKKMATKIENTSRDMIQNMSDIVWSINPSNDTMEKLIYRLQQFCNDVFEKPNIKHQFSIDDELRHKVLDMQLRRDVYLVCKEIINNAAKYSQATLFNLSLSLKQKIIFINADDNGIGFNENITNKGNGLINIKQRIQNHNGNVSLTTSNGATWQISIPI
jgi:signal transduction histidine kinase/ligand-binding sensor domain-containing protein